MEWHKLHTWSGVTKDGGRRRWECFRLSFWKMSWCYIREWGFSALKNGRTRVTPGKTQIPLKLRAPKQVGIEREMVLHTGGILTWGTLRIMSVQQINLKERLKQRKGPVRSLYMDKLDNQTTPAVRVDTSTPNLDDFICKKLCKTLMKTLIPKEIITYYIWASSTLFFPSQL